jgi:hypothetical protein
VRVRVCAAVFCLNSLVDYCVCAKEWWTSCLDVDSLMQSAEGGSPSVCAVVRIAVRCC